MNKRAAGIITAGFFTVFVAFAIRYSYGIILPHMLPALAISKTDAGIIFSCYFFTYTIFAPLFGFLADRYDVKIILSVFVAILGAGAYLMSLSYSLIQACLFFSLAGIGHSACWSPVVTVVMRWTSEKRRGIIISIVDLGTTAGIAVWSIVIPFIITTWNWRMVWISLGITAFLVAGMNYLLIRSYPPQEPTSPGLKISPEIKIPVKETYKAIFRNPKFHLIGSSYSMISFSILVPFTFLTTYATRTLMIPYASATSLIVVIAVSGAIGKLVLGHLSDIAGRVRIMMLCGILIACGNMGIALAPGYPMLFLSSIIFGIGYGTLWSVYAASARDLFPQKYSGSILGLWTLYHGLGSIISPVISGWTIDSTGTYFWAFLIAMTGSLISLVLLIPLYNAKRAQI